MADLHDHVQERQQAREKREALLKEAEKQQAEFNAALARLAKTKDGITVLRGISHLCGHNQSSFCGPDEGGVERTAFNEGRRAVYLSLRAHMNYNDAVEIERPQQKGE